MPAAEVRLELIDAAELAETLRTDLARFTFLLGSDDGEQLFGHDRGEHMHRPDQA